METGHEWSWNVVESHFGCFVGFSALSLFQQFLHKCLIFIAPVLLQQFCSFKRFIFMHFLRPMTVPVGRARSTLVFRRDGTVTFSVCSGIVLALLKDRGLVWNGRQVPSERSRLQMLWSLWIFSVLFDVVDHKTSRLLRAAKCRNLQGSSYRIGLEWYASFYKEHRPII